MSKWSKALSFLKKVFLKTPVCEHEWNRYKINDPSGFSQLNGEYHCLACPKCEQVKEGSKHFVRY